MKKILCLVLAMLLLAGCAADPIESTPPAETTLPPETAAPTETEPVSDELLYFRENLPVMDGSTSLIPLEAGIRSAIFGISLEEATAQVSHTTTWGSFQNLLDGTADLIFSVDLSQEQLAIAADAGITLESVPIAQEGFVFVVNAANPVDTLTQEQLRGIYSGTITNWSEVGGNDEPIIAYQRNSDSGSQNYMTAFMGDTPLTDAPTELRPASMSGLMDVIAVNDNASAAIGYSVYAYAADMYGNGNEIKFIQVDGVAPSKTTFADGSYPLMGNNYAIFRSDEAADSPVRRLVAWMVSDDGQTAIAQAGYVTVRDIGFDYQESTLTKYRGTGTGVAANADTSEEYVLKTAIKTATSTNYLEYLRPEIVTQVDGTKTYRITQLTDKALESRINDWISQQMVWAAEVYPQVGQLVDAMNTPYTGYSPYSLGPTYPMADTWVEDMPAACYVTCTNGYLSVVISTGFHFSGMVEIDHFYRVETATWDLHTGQRLETEDLFCEGVDIDAVLNEYLTAVSQQPVNEFYSYEMKQDFAGLTDSGWYITHDTVYFDASNPYFYNGISISLTDLPEGVLACQQTRDFSQALSVEDTVSVRQFRMIDRDTYYAYNADGLLSCEYLVESAHPNAEKINNTVKAYLDTYYTEEAIRGYFEDLGHSTENLDLFMMDWYMENWGGKYLCFLGYAPELYLEESRTIVQYPCGYVLLFDLSTGEQIQWQDLLREGWQDAIVWSMDRIPEQGAETPSYGFDLHNGRYLCVLMRDEVTYYYANIPMEYLFD